MKNEEVEEESWKESVEEHTSQQEQDQEARRSVEQVITPVEFGSFWRRFFALFIDGIIIGILGTVIAFITGISGYLLPFIITVLYFTISFRRGRTFGKALLGLRVMNLEGNVPNFGCAFLRSLPLGVLMSSAEITEGLPQLAYPLNIPMNIVVRAVGAFAFLASFCLTQPDQYPLSCRVARQLRCRAWHSFYTNQDFDAQTL